MHSFFKKHKVNLIIVVIIALLFIPQTAMPIRVFVSKLFAFSPSQIDVEAQVTLDSYQWTLLSITGEEKNLSNSQGKVIVVNFWATWCPPCVAEMPSLQALYDTYGNRVDFYFVSQESPDKLERFMKKKGYSFPVYIQKFHAPSAIDAAALPTTYIISKTDKIVVDKTGAANWDSDKVNTILNELLLE